VEMTVPGHLAFRSVEEPSLAEKIAIRWRMAMGQRLQTPVWARIHTNKVVRKNSESR